MNLPGIWEKGLAWVLPYSRGLICLAAFCLILLALMACLRLAAALKRRCSGPMESLDQWARKVHFSNSQLTAMRSLWQWYRTGREPGVDPLKHLDPGELADLLNKCGSEYIPEKFRSAEMEKKRQAMTSELESAGFENMQAEIVTGMKFGKLGPCGGERS